MLPATTLVTIKPVPALIEPVLVTMALSLAPNWQADVAAAETVIKLLAAGGHGAAKAGATAIAASAIAIAIAEAMVLRVEEGLPLALAFSWVTTNALRDSLQMVRCVRFIDGSLSLFFIRGRDATRKIYSMGGVRSLIHALIGRQ